MKHLENVEKSAHIPVLMEPTLAAFDRCRGRHFLDGTFGGGGHCRALLDRFPKAVFFAMDRDGDAIARGQADKAFDRVQFFHGTFEDLDRLPRKKFDGILLDLGISSDQLEKAERGFAFRVDGPLDMRMDRSRGLSAAQFLELCSEAELAAALRDFGEEKSWRRLVRAILAARGTGAFDSTASFADLIRRTLGPGRRGKIDPATKTFQAIRIAVNDELGILRRTLEKIPDHLEDDAIVAIIAFHSLEDRLVKQAFRLWSGLAINRSDRRFSSDRQRFGQMLTRRPTVPDEEEIRANPRARSARLRVFWKRIREGGQS